MSFLRPDEHGKIGQQSFQWLALSGTEGGTSGSGAWKSSTRTAKRSPTTASLNHRCIRKVRQVWPAVYPTCLGHKVEAKTAHITNSPLDKVTCKPNFHANIKVRGDSGKNPHYHLSNCMYYHLREAKGSILFLYF